MFVDNGLRRIVHQVWDWHDERRYSVHLYITRQTSGPDWQSSHFVGHYRAITPDELASIASRVGFNDVRVLAQAENLFAHEIAVAVRE